MRVYTISSTEQVATEDNNKRVCKKAREKVAKVQPRVIFGGYVVAYCCILLQRVARGREFQGMY
jgi:hypothetical protein